MFSLFSRRNKKETVLIFDIGSGSVAGAYVELSVDKEPRILYSKREPIKFQKNLQGARFKKEMYKSFSIVLKDLSKKTPDLASKGKRLNRVLCSLASPWFVSQTNLIKIVKEEPFDVTENLLADVLEKGRKNFKNSSFAKYGEDKTQDSEIIENKIVDIKLNGYKIDNPVGKLVKGAEFSVFMSMSQSSILDEIESLILQHFFVEEIIFHSFTLISFSAIRDMFDRISNFLLLDITGEVTDVSLVRDNNLIKTTSFSQGKNSVIRKLATDLKIETKEAYSNLKFLFSDSLNKTKKDMLLKKTEASRSLWLKEFQKSLSALSGGLILPTTVFFTADDDLSAWYGKAIKTEQYAQQAMTNGPFVVNFINSLSLDSYVRFNDKSQKDTFLALISLFFNRMFELEP